MSPNSRSTNEANSNTQPRLAAHMGAQTAAKESRPPNSVPSSVTGSPLGHAQADSGNKDALPPTFFRLADHLKAQMDSRGRRTQRSSSPEHPSSSLRSSCTSLDSIRATVGTRGDIVPQPAYTRVRKPSQNPSFGAVPAPVPRLHKAPSIKSMKADRHFVAGPSSSVPLKPQKVPVIVKTGKAPSIKSMAASIGMDFENQNGSGSAVPPVPALPAAYSSSSSTAKVSRSRKDTGKSITGKGKANVGSSSSRRGIYSSSRASASTPAFPVFAAMTMYSPTPTPTPTPSPSPNSSLRGKSRVRTQSHAQNQTQQTRTPTNQIEFSTTGHSARGTLKSGAASSAQLPRRVALRQQEPVTPPRRPQLVSRWSRDTEDGTAILNMPPVPVPPIPPAKKSPGFLGRLMKRVRRGSF